MNPRKVTVKVIEPQKSYPARSPSPLKQDVVPVFRPKAKINSSATSNLVTRKAASTVSASPLVRTGSARSTVSTSSTPRSGSPTRPPNASPVPRPRAGITRGLASRSQGTLRRQSDASRAEIVDLSGDEPTEAPSPRITAKLSKLSRNVADESSAPPSPQLRAPPHRARVPSVSSAASTSSSPFYGSGARGSPPTGNYYQSFDTSVPTKFTARTNGLSAKVVDPTSVPLPTNSPPTSTLSFSSRSSVSHSSASFATESGASQLSVPDKNIRGGLENLLGFSGLLPEEDDQATTEDDDYDSDEREPDPERQERQRVSAIEREVRAEAKSVRKIADLEITNRSLLTINTSLEQTKHRQAKEIRELRRKLRESRLILPPREFRAVKPTPEEEETDDDEEEDAEEAERTLAEHDVTYRRIKVILEGLIESGQRALETTPKDFPEPVKVAKVLSAYEMQDEDADDAEQRPTSPSRVAVPDSDDEFKSEEEVEAMTLPRGSPSPSPATSPRAIR
ncbi:hypothetical protein MKEN_01285600 [Mycena kentingensis (nom. inval.)]|nr:hypothetical protein MKEN_01285600 [Mycena kentingensis (nom. inval.)]